MKRVLVIAGGGVFGYVPSYFMASTDASVDLHEKIDAIGGTSVGGILSLLYASGMNPEAAHNQFKRLVDKAFPSKWYTKMKFWGPKYSGRGLEKALYQSIGDESMKDLKLPVVVPSMDFVNNKPKVWDNFEGNVDGWENAWEVGRRTSSAPTYFPPWKGHIDGGLLSNIPILETVSALKHKKGWRFADMSVMVLGTGMKALDKHDVEKIRKWGALKWLMPLLDYLTFANEQSSLFVAKQLGLGRLKVFNPVQLQKGWSMDDPSLLPKLDAACSRFRPSFNDELREFLD